MADLVVLQIFISVLLISDNICQMFHCCHRFVWISKYVVTSIYEPVKLCICVVNASLLTCLKFDHSSSFLMTSCILEFAAHSVGSVNRQGVFQQSSFMNQCVFSLTGLFLLRETRFQQATPVFIRSWRKCVPSNFIYTWGVSENVCLNIFINDIILNFQFL